MVKIRGVSISGSSIQIMGNRIFGGNSNGKKQTIDDKREVDSNDVKKITINSAFANVSINPSDSNNIEVWLRGEAEISGELDFDVKTINNVLNVFLNFKGDNYWYSGYIKLDITVPKKLFKEIFLEGTSSDLSVEKGVLAETLKVKTMSGDIEVTASPDTVEISTQSGDVEATVSSGKVDISTMSGDVTLEINAIKDVRVKVSTMSGDVESYFYNIGQLNLSTKTMSGDVTNHHKDGKGYTANVNISTMSGDIKIV